MYLAHLGPPNSPPIALQRRTSNMMIATTASEQNSVTEKAKLRKEIDIVSIFTLGGSLFEHDENILSRIDSEHRSFAPMIHGRNGPCHANSKEDIHSITASHIANTSVCVFVLNCCHFTSECI